MAERNSHSSTGDSHRSTPTPFLTKTYHLVDNPAIDDVISWNDTGTSFIVWNPTVFASDLLPKHFKHNNFSSFVRQLNTYGFKKLVPDRWEFFNDCFRRGEKRLLCDIQRRKIVSPSPPVVSNAGTTAEVAVTSASPFATIPKTKPIVSPSISEEEQVISSNSSQSITQAELLDENERLRKENMKLKKELDELKSLCSKIFNLISDFGKSQGGDGDKGKECCSTAMETLRLLPAKQCNGEDAADTAVEDMSPKLFGVAIGRKRGREGRCVEDNTVLKLHQQVHAGVKSEPFDQQSGKKRKTLWFDQYHSSNRSVCE